MRKYIILFTVIIFIVSSCATGMRDYGYDNEYDNPGQGSYYYRHNSHRSHWWKRNRDYRNDRDYRNGDRDYDDYGYGNSGNYDHHHNRHHHHRKKGVVIVF